MSTNVDTSSILLEMLKKYDVMQEQGEYTPEEFVKECICTQKLFVETSSEIVVDAFLKICSMRKFLESLLSLANICKSNSALVVLYTLLFGISNITVNVCLRTCLQKDQQRKFVKFFFKQDVNVVLHAITLAANEIYDIEYTNTIVKSIKEQLEMNHFEVPRTPEKRKKITKKTITLCRPPAFLLNIPPVPENTAVNSVTDVSIDIPCSTELDNMAKMSKGMEIVERSQRINQRICWKKSLNHEIKVAETVTTTIVRKKSCDTVPTFKVNKATVLRCGARINENLAHVDKLLSDLMSGSQIPLDIGDNENDIHARARKRLMVLLSHEDTKLAKILATERKQLQAQRVKLEKALCMRQRKQIRLQEMERLKKMVYNNSVTKELAKESYAKCVEEKRRAARDMNDELCRMKDEAMKKRQRELKEKTELIREIKRLEQTNREMKCFKKLDKHKSPSYGLFSEMSIDELQVALQNIKSEVEQKKKLQNEKIQREKCRQKELVAEMASKMERFSNLPRQRIRRAFEDGDANQNTCEDKDLIELRNKLEEKKQLTRLKSMTSM